MANIPAKQLFRYGTYSDLVASLSEREIGICSTDGLVYYRTPDPVGGENLVPIGIHYFDGTGIKIDSDRRINLTERTTLHPVQGDVIQGALQIFKGIDTTDLVVKVGNSDGIGALAPIPASGSKGKVLGVVGENGEIGWMVADVSMDSPNDTVDIASEIVNNQKVYHIKLHNVVVPGGYARVTVDEYGRVVGGGVLESDDIPDGLINLEKINLEDVLPVIAGDGISIDNVNGWAKFSVIPPVSTNLFGTVGSGVSQALTSSDVSNGYKDFVKILPVSFYSSAANLVISVFQIALMSGGVDAGMTAATYEVYAGNESEPTKILIRNIGNTGSSDYDDRGLLISDILSDSDKPVWNCMLQGSRYIVDIDRIVIRVKWKDSSFGNTSNAISMLNTFSLMMPSDTSEWPPQVQDAS